MECIEFARNYISDYGFRVLDDGDGHLAFRYQMNIIHFFCNSDEENFFVMTLSIFEKVTAANIGVAKELCHKINAEKKQVKLYVMKDVVLAAAEVYFLAEEDFQLQMKKALQNLVSAKVMYCNKL